MKSVLITGASSGIGEATAKYLSSVGYFVVLVARNIGKLEELKAEIGQNVLCISYDLKDLDNIKSIFDICKSNDIVLDGLVHCAGIAGNLPVKSMNSSFVQNMMDVNLMSFIEMTKVFLNRKYSRNGASIVAMSSLASVTCYPGTAAYSVSKASLNTFCKVLSKEIAKREQRINTVMPGYVRTPMMGETTDNEVMIQQSFGYIEPIEIAYVVEFLLSNKSSKITGANIPVSAGMNF